MNQEYCGSTRNWQGEMSDLNEPKLIHNSSNFDILRPYTNSGARIQRANAHAFRNLSRLIGIVCARDLQDVCQFVCVAPIRCKLHTLNNITLTGSVVVVVGSLVRTLLLISNSNEIDPESPKGQSSAWNNN